MWKGGKQGHTVQVRWRLVRHLSTALQPIKRPSLTAYDGGNLLSGPTRLPHLLCWPLADKGLTLSLQASLRRHQVPTRPTTGTIQKHMRLCAAILPARSSTASNCKTALQ